SWRRTWDTFLQKEMARGRCATYQLCLDLRLLLCEGNEQRLHELADELLVALAAPDQPQPQERRGLVRRRAGRSVALRTITNIYMRELLALRDPQGHQYPPDLLVLLD